MANDQPTDWNLRLAQFHMKSRVRKAIRPILDDSEEFIKGLETKEEKLEASNGILEILRVSFQEIYAEIGAHINRGEKK